MADGPTGPWRKYGPLLNGEPVLDCYLADEEEGYVEVWQLDEEGRRRIDVPRLRLEGEVKLIPIAEYRALLEAQPPKITDTFPVFRMVAERDERLEIPDGMIAETVWKPED